MLVGTEVCYQALVIAHFVLKYLQCLSKVLLLLTSCMYLRCGESNTGWQSLTGKYSMWYGRARRQLMAQCEVSSEEDSGLRSARLARLWAPSYSPRENYIGHDRYGWNVLKPLLNLIHLRLESNHISIHLTNFIAKL